MSNKGYIRLGRGYFDNPLWDEPREYSRAEAWLDLIQSARFDSSKVMFKGRVIELQRGEIMASRRFLEERWRWSNSKVDKFLDLLVLQGMIERKNANGIGIINLCNYVLYNPLPDAENATEAPRKRHRSATETPNINKENNIHIPLSPNGDIPTLAGGNVSVDPNSETPPIVQVTPSLAEDDKKKKLREKEKENFDKFQLWIKENASRVANLQSPFTQAEFSRLKRDYNIEQIKETLTSMHNYKPLLSRSVSANLTFRKWAKKEYNNDANNSTASTQRPTKPERDSEFEQHIAAKLAGCTR